MAELCERGDAHVEAGELDRALERYKEALSLLPQPLYRWNAATWILTAMGETSFFLKDYRQARSTLEEALRCPKGLGNPFIHLRLGQAALELGDEDLARDQLACAYVLRKIEVRVVGRRRDRIEGGRGGTPAARVGRAQECGSPR